MQRPILLRRQQSGRPQVGQQEAELGDHVFHAGGIGHSCRRGDRPGRAGGTGRTLGTIRTDEPLGSGGSSGTDRTISTRRAGRTRGANPAVCTRRASGARGADCAISTRRTGRTRGTDCASGTGGTGCTHRTRRTGRPNGPRGSPFLWTTNRLPLTREVPRRGGGRDTATERAAYPFHFRYLSLSQPDGCQLPRQREPLGRSNYLIAYGHFLMYD